MCGIFHADTMAWLYGILGLIFSYSKQVSEDSIGFPEVQEDQV